MHAVLEEEIYRELLNPVLRIMTKGTPADPEQSEVGVCVQTSAVLSEDCLKVTLGRLSSEIPEILPLAVVKTR